jgi:hypothetical protein
LLYHPIKLVIVDEENCNYFHNSKNNYLDIEYLFKHWELHNNKLILKDKLELSFNLKK